MTENLTDKFFFNVGILSWGSCCIQDQTQIVNLSTTGDAWFDPTAENFWMLLSNEAVKKKNPHQLLDGAVQHNSVKIV